ncbi:MAG TPA: potassium-transporting ATPase subunit C [Acidimicrobiales bacterium]|jgi:K+-transporting ATPase ATPase C chain|nr:potassium-transporting ATPase subunit C [Acidimicrobiales bacterium]
MLVNLRRAVAFSVLLIVLCLAYTLVETVVGQTFFASQANGSVVKVGKVIIGSSSIGQSWTGPEWFQGRDDPDDAAASGPTNYGPRSLQLVEQVQQRITQLQKEGITATNGLVTGSGSGLDPDISPADAYAQVDAVAKANHLPVAEVRALVARTAAPRYDGIFGEPYVDVLSLNIALAKLTGELKT